MKDIEFYLDNSRELHSLISDVDVDQLQKDFKNSVLNRMALNVEEEIANENIYILDDYEFQLKALLSSYGNSELFLERLAELKSRAQYSTSSCLSQKNYLIKALNEFISHVQKYGSE